MTKLQLAQYLIGKGWTQDRFGHFHKGEYRIKVQARSVRLEKWYRTEASAYSRSEKRYIRLRSGYLSKLFIGDQGKLCGLA